MGQTRKRHEPGVLKSHVKKGDDVLVLAGRSLGQHGRILSVDPQRERAMVEGVNLITKHQRSQGQGRNSAVAAAQQSGRIEKPSHIHLSNLMLVCPGCAKPTRVAHKDVDGRSVRACKQCGNPVDKTD
jgi:large subunit ribosomal protein L24